jgi:nitrite reductase/ring-hydroxylating ferredoxin subunit
MTIDYDNEQVLCQLTDIADGKSKGFLTENREDKVLAVRKRDTVYVYMNSCPHEWVPMDLRKDYFLTGNGQEIMCYAHSAHFNIESGVCTAGPCLHQELIKVPNRIEDGAVIIPLMLPHVPSTRRFD